MSTIVKGFYICALGFNGGLKVGSKQSLKGFTNYLYFGFVDATILSGLKIVLKVGMINFNAPLSVLYLSYIHYISNMNFIFAVLSPLNNILMNTTLIS